MANELRLGKSVVPPVGHDVRGRVAVLNPGARSEMGHTATPRKRQRLLPRRAHIFPIHFLGPPVRNNRGRV